MPRAVLALSSPFLRVACLTLLALVGSRALTPGMSALAEGSAAYAASTAQLIASPPVRLSLAPVPGAPARVLSSSHQAASAWLREARVALGAVSVLWRADRDVSTAQVRHLLVAVTLARAH